MEVQSDGLVPVEFAKHRDNGATLVLSNQRSGETAEAAAGRLAAAAESGRLGSLREGGEQGTGAVPQNWPAGLRAGLAQKPGVVSVPQLARSDPARAESGLANRPLVGRAVNLRPRAGLPQVSEPMQLYDCTVLHK